MIIPSGPLKVLVAVKPVDFRWPRFGEGVMKVTGAQADALIERDCQ
jgi:hypothetical protein